MLWWVPLLPLALGLVVWVFAPERRGWLAAVGGGAVALSAVWAAIAVASGWRGTYAVAPTLTLRAALDPIAATLVLLVPLVALPVTVYAAFHEEARGLRRLTGLLLVFVGAMQLLVVAADLLTLLVGWELVGACSWALITHVWREPANTVAATRAFLVTRAGDLGLFVAAGAAFAGAGRLDYAALATLSPEWLGLVAAGVVLAAVSKSAQLPFSPWLFAAMAGPTSVSALLHAATMVAAGAFVLARLEPVLSAVPWFGPVVLAAGLATALVGGAVALFQAHAKKLLAASTAAQYGFMFVAIGAGHPAVATLHLVAHALFKALLFLAAGIAHEARGTWRLAGLHVGSALPALAAASALGALALGGVPPLGAAWTKEALVSAAGVFAPWAAVALAIAGGLGAAYAFRFQRGVFAAGGAQLATPPGRAVQAPVLALAAATALVSVVWWPGVGAWLVRTLGGAPPAWHAWEVALSLGLVALGLQAARSASLAARPARGAGAVVAEWCGLSALGVAGFERPGLRLARGLAGFDDRVLHAPVRALADAVPQGAGGLSRFDDGALGRAPRRLARATEQLARGAARVAEHGFDALPEGLARITWVAGDDARRTQTGLSHHYYVAMTLGLVLLLATLAAGG